MLSDLGCATDGLKLVFSSEREREGLTRSTEKVSGSLPRGSGSVQLSTTYVLLTSHACTFVGGNGILTWPVKKEEVEKEKVSKVPVEDVFQSF